MTKYIRGILIGEAPSEEKAETQTRSMKNCPYLISGGYTLNKFHYIFIVPEEKKWWLEYPVSSPNVIGAKKVTLELVTNIIKPDRFEFTIPEEKSKTSPGGANCETCPLRLEYHCACCPATIYYKKKD